MSTIVHRLFEAIDAQQWNRLPEFFHPQIVYERPGYPRFSGLVRLHTFYLEERVIHSGVHVLSQVLIDENAAAAWGRFQGVHRDGSPIHEDFADVYQLRDGWISYRKSFFFRPAV